MKEQLLNQLDLVTVDADIIAFTDAPPGLQYVLVAIEKNGISIFDPSLDPEGRGAPRYFRSDNGPEFVATKLLEWAVQEKLESVLIDPGKPWQNGTNESFNGKFRDECLSMEWFRNRLEARVIIEDWRQHYNAVRPHSSLNYRTPNEFAAGLKNDLPTETRELSSQW